MAVKDCDKLSNIVAIGIAAGDEDLAQQISRLSVQKRESLIRAGNLKGGDDAVDSLTGWTAHELELKANSADIELRAIVQAKILNQEINVGDAYLELAKQIKKTGGTIAGGVDLLEKVRNANMADWEEIARLWGDNTTDAGEAVSNIQKAISDFTATNYSISTYSEFVNDKLGTLRSQLNAGTITKEEYDAGVKSAHKEAMDAIAKGENPTGFVKLDKEWQTIKKIYGNDVEKAQKAWTQFVMARELLTDGGLNDDVLRAFSDFGGENLVGDLTFDQLEKYGKGDLDKLLARAYTNTEQLYHNGALRQRYREKLIEVASSTELGKEDVEKISSLSKTLQFADQGASFSDVLVRDKIYRSAQKRGLDVAGTDGSRLYKGLIGFSKELESNPNILDKEIKIAGVKMEPIDVIQLIYDITGDDNIIQLIRIGNLDDGTILDVATRSLLGESKVAADKILKLFSKAKETAKIVNARDLALKSITGENIKEGAKVGFFDYKEGLYVQDELNRTKANFYDKLAERNKMRVDASDIVNLTSTDDAETLAKALKENIGGGYLLVNDVKWKDNETLRNAVEIANKGVKEDNKIIVLSPNRAMEANFTFEDGNLYFKTTNDQLYKDVAGTISIQSLGEARPTREIVADMYEAMTGRNGDKLRYQPSYNKAGTDNLGRAISDQQVDYGFLTDDAGNVKTFYHWTSADFDEFSLDHFRSGSGDSQVWGFYFTTEKDWKVLLRPDEANRQIEVYIKAEHPVMANAPVTDIMSEGAFTRMIKSYHEVIGDTFDQGRREYKINEWFTPHGIGNKPSTIAHVLSNVGEYDGIFGNDPKRFMEFFKNYTGVDGLRDGDKIFVAFSPNQMKYVDNRLPTSSANMKYQPAWHGSGYDFDAFDLKYVGMGAGGTAHGYGVYVTLDRDIARAYAVNNSFERKGSWKGLSSGDLNDSLSVLDISSLDDAERQIAFDILDWMKSGKSFDEAVRIERESLESSLGYPLPEGKRQRFENKLEALGMLKRDDFKVGGPTRHLYEVDIPDDKKVKTITGENYFNEDGLLTKRQINQFKKKLSEFNPAAGQKLAEGNYYIEGGNSLLLALEDVLGNKKSVSEFFESLGYDGYRYVSKESGNARILFRAGDVKITDKTSWQRRAIELANEADVNAEDAMKVKMFNKDRTAQQIADAYGFDVRIVQGDMIEGVAAYGAYGNGVIYFTDMVKESTAPHELFHAIFDIVNKEERTKIIEDSMKLFGYNADEAEEVLADAFSEWFRTGKFKYGKVTKKSQKSFFEKVEKFFRDVAEWLGLVDAHRGEVEQMFKDMVNMQYLPDAGKSVSKTKALEKYNKELNDTAVKYFGEMLGLSTEEVDAEYVNRVKTLLSDRIGIDLKAFDVMDDQAALWQRIDKQFAIDRLTAGKYDKELVDINGLKREIDGYTHEELAREIRNSIGDMVSESKILSSPNIEHIREAYLDYMSAGSAVDSLTAKGKIISLANGGEAQKMSMQDIKNMFKNNTFEEVYKKMFFPDQDVSKKDMERFVRSINDNIFDTLSIGFAENLVDAGYALPLVNIKDLVYDFLTDNLDLNSAFVEAFFYKNDIPFTSDGLNTLINTLMPNEFVFDYEESLFKGRFSKIEKLGEASVFRETDNRFLQDSYSALAAIQMARAGDMPINYEEEILTNILDKYVNEIYQGVKSGALTFKDAQGIKQEASYALDMFEQDFLIPRYGRFLSQQEKQGLMGMKYALPIGVKGQNPDVVSNELREARNRLLQKYKTTIGSAARNNEINLAIVRGTDEGLDDYMKEQVDARRQQLIDSGGVIREVNGQYIVYDAKQALLQTIDSLPTTISGLEGLRALGKDGIEQLSNRQAYALLRYLEAAKGLNATANYAMELMYKQSPMLQKYMFFDAFRVEDGLPKALKSNALVNNELLSKLDNTAILDQEIKEDIFAGIISKFRQNGHVEMSDITELAKDATEKRMSNYVQAQFSPSEISEIKENMVMLYENAFTPYTYLRDIPKGGKLLDGTDLPNIKKKVQDTMKQQYTQAISDLKAAGIDDFGDIQDTIYIRLADGTDVSLRDAANMDIDSWKKSIFNDESVFVSGADEMKIYSFGDATTQAEKDDIIAQEKVYRDEIINNYNSTLQAMMNQTQVITDAENRLMNTFMNNVRTDLRRYTLTNQLVDALDAVSGLNEEAARGIKDYLIGFLNDITFGKWRPNQIMDRYNLVKDAYAKYYVMDLAKLSRITPTTQAEDLALRLAKYFKNLERLLGSADGLTGVTTSKDINKAFYRIGETFMNLEGTRGVFGMLSAIEQNQVLKFFKFSKGDVRKWAEPFVRKGTAGFEEGLGGYRDYVETISGITAGEFNQIFGSNYNENEFKRILQGLTGFSITGDGWGRKGIAVMNFLGGSNFIARFFMSYPGQLLTIPQQSTAYFLKQIGFEKELGIESLSDIDAVRKHYGILDGAYNEINLFREKSLVSPDDLNTQSFYNRYGIPDVDSVYSKSPIQTTDDYINMYAKIDNQAASSESEANKWMRQMDPYKDNANNIIDGLFARNFKNISFLKAIKQNDFMQFTSAKAFKEFMDDADISAAIKTRLMDRVSAYSGRNFRNILGLGFGGLERPVAGSGFGNIMYGLMQLFNFRGAWGQNIFKQTGEAIFTGLHMIRDLNLGQEGRDAIAKYIATQPEFLNFVGILFNDIRWTWKLQRYQDNGRWPVEDDMYGLMDFLDYFRQTMNMTSQWYQGLQSFGPFRPFDEAAGSMIASATNPTVYKDTFGIGAFINSLGKNFGRQWKPYNWLAKLAGALTTDGPSGAWAYIQNKFWELSFGSLRYMTNEDMNAYGYTYELIGDTGGIPSIIVGESPMYADKAFLYDLDNTETWNTVQEIFDTGNPWSAKSTYIGNIWKTFVNGSQLFSFPKNVWRAIKQNAPSPYTANDLSDVIQNTSAGREFYEKGYVTPSSGLEAKEFFDIMLKNSQFRPGSSNFNKSLIQFEDYGHMNGSTDKGNKNDAEMELWLQHMKYQTNEHGEFVTENGQKVIDPAWEDLIQGVRSNFNNQTYCTNLIYAYSKAWLNKHSSDPNYQLYVKMLGQGHAHNLIENGMDAIAEFLNVGAGKGADNKWSDSEVTNSGLYLNLLYALGSNPLEGDTIPFFDRVQMLDQDNSTVAALELIKGQMSGEDRKILEKFFNVTEEDDGSKTIDLRYQYKSMLTQLGAISRAFSEGNVERGVAEASSLVHMYKNADPTGAITASLIDSIYDRIYSTNTLSALQKQEAMIALFHDNKEFIQRNPEKMRELLGDAYDVYADYMNQMLYRWDGKIISNLESIQSSGSKSSSSAASSAAKVSSAFKKMASNLGGTNYSKTQSMQNSYYKDWVPVQIKGADLVKDLGVRGYTPSYKTIAADIKSYKPHIDLSVAKDINRNVKTTKTQTVSSKKQLSDIEKKTTKALMAES